MEDDSHEFSWTTFYMELADKLTMYRNDRVQLLSTLERAHDDAGVPFPKIEDGEPVDVDPFTVFGMFNKKIADKKRTAICRAFKDAFDLASSVPDDFAGVPRLNNFKATFYWFGDGRGAGDIDNLWGVFQAALRLADEDDVPTRNAFMVAYDTARSQKGVRWNLTMALHWVRPYAFVNLDSRNRWFVGDEGMLGGRCADAVHTLGSTPPDAATYLSMRDLLLDELKTAERPFHDFPSLSQAAWFESERVNKEKEAKSNALGDADVETARYWLYAPGKSASMWDEFRRDDIMGIGWSEVGDLRGYTSKGAIASALKDGFGEASSYVNDALALWQFANEVKPGDVVFAKRGMHQVVGRGVVASDYSFDPSRADEYKNVREVRWDEPRDVLYPGGQAPVKTLTDITPYADVVEVLEAAFADEADEDEATAPTNPPYGRDGFLSEVYLGEERYDRLARLLRTRRNVILQGPPGVGKTFMAKRLAYSLMGEKDQSRVELVQFHQSYSYEDFVMGYRPTAGGFELRPGSFYDFCRRAEADSDQDYYFVIDEINRGNLSKIFGELFMLVEPDKRGVNLRLMYTDKPFCVPPNVYLLGTMNTADRSLAMMDFALRRRFAFFDLAPGFDTEGFASYQASVDSPAMDGLVSCIGRLNQAISDDPQLGSGFRIGHSFLCGLEGEDDVEAALADVVGFELAPLLKEYWFDEPERAREWADELRASLA